MALARLKDWAYPQQIKGVEDVDTYLRKHYEQHVEESQSRVEDFENLEIDIVTVSEINLDNTGLHLLDTDASHDLIIKPGSDLDADRILTLTTGNAARTITLSGNPTLSDWFDQTVKVASSPTFNDLKTSDNIGIGITAWGTSAAKVLGIGGSTAPSTSPANMIQLWSADRDGTAGDATLYYRMEGGLARPLGETYNVVDYGATGAGAGTDDYAAIAACIAAAPAGSTIYFPKPTSYYKLTDELAINKSLRLFGDTIGSSIVQSSNSKGVFIITVSDVVVDRLKLTGTHVAYAARDTGERAINIQGANNGAKISDIHIRNCKIVDFGDIGIYSKYVTDFSYVNNIVDNCYYAGITGASVLRGEIRNNKISDIEADNSESTLAYGIILASEGASDDRPTDVNVSRNKVINIHTWEGIDTHAGVRVNYTENEVYGCRTGIMMGSDGNYGHSPIDCNVLGNIVDSGVTDGTIAAGITFHGKEETIVGDTNGNTTIDSLADTDGVHAGMWIEGADIPAGTTVVSVDSSTQITISDAATGSTADVSFHMFSLATGIISNNIVRGCGKEDSTSTGGMVTFCTKGLDISNNSLIECAPFSINITNDNYGFTCDGNTIVDNWSNTSNDSNIYCRQDNNTGHIGGNSFSKDTKSATYHCKIGIEVSNNSGNAITLGTNYSEATTYLVDAGDNTSSTFKDLTATGEITSLQTFAASSARVIIHADSTTTTGYLDFNVNNNAIVIPATTGYFDITEYTSNDNLLHVQADGDIGIGETTPEARFHIIGEGNSTPLLHLETTGTNHREFRFKITGATADYDTLYLEGNTASAGDTFADVMVWKASGEVGIGTDSPGGQIESVSSVLWTAASNPANQDSLLIGNSASSEGQGNFGASIGFKRLDNAGLREAAIVAVQTGTDLDHTGLAFFTHPSSTSSQPTVEAMRIEHDGNVGIGTTTWGTNAVTSLGIAIGTEPSSSIAGQIEMYAKDSSDGAANATLGFRTEQAVEVIGTFTASHKLKVWINGTEYWLQLDAV